MAEADAPLRWACEAQHPNMRPNEWLEYFSSEYRPDCKRRYEESTQLYGASGSRYRLVAVLEMSGRPKPGGT